MTPTSPRSVDSRSGRLDDKVALITGGGSGIGKAIAVRFAEEGARVFVTSKARSDLDSAFQEIEATSGASIEGLELDVRDSRAVDALVERIRRNVGAIDILSNNAGVELVHSPSIEELTNTEWDEVLNVNLTGTFYVCRSAIPIVADGGSIINMGSVKSIAPRINAAPYVASKAGLLHFTKTLALEVGVRQIRANCVCPGTIDTPLTSAFLEKSDEPEQLQATYEAKSVFRRMGTPGEVANCVLFLASDESSFVTGTAFVVDGGALLK